MEKNQHLFVHTRRHTRMCTDHVLWSSAVLQIDGFQAGVGNGLAPSVYSLCAQLNLIPITSIHEIMTRLEMESLAINSGLVMLSIFSKYLLNTYHSYSKMIAVV